MSFQFFCLILQPIFEIMDKLSENSKISKRDYTGILETVMASLTQKGFKATTMDSIASQLSMSKRTLYEIFENKDQMFVEAIKYSRRQIRVAITRIFTQSATVIEAMIKVMEVHQKTIEQVTPQFFLDMDSYAKKMRELYDEENITDMELGFSNIIKMGINQDVFREDVDYRISFRLIHIQMESLKRAEEFFPKDVTLSEIFNTLSINFLRSIATIKGLSIIDEYYKELKIEN